VKEISLTKGKIAIVDDADYEWLAHRGWFAIKTKWTWYAGRYEEDKKTGKRRLVLMHRAILGLRGFKTDKIEGDHRNHNGLDNRRKNLRIATRLQNAANHRLQKNNTSGHSGVHIYKRTGRWQAYIKVNRKRIHIGFFATREEAVRAREQAAKKYYGEFAPKTQESV
jgi:AP2 domain